MDIEVRSQEEEVVMEEYVDWKGRAADSKNVGGMRAASITCVVETLENLVFLSNATNFVSYFMLTMSYPSAVAANMVTNFMGTSFLLTLLAGFVTDSFLNRFWTFVLSGIIELLGLGLLTIQAHTKSLQPPKGRTPSTSQAALLYFGLYSMAIGVGGIKASLPTHGADQINHSNQRLISAFFNWFFFSLCAGGLISSTVMIWVEENLGWRSSFNISMAVLFAALCIFMSGFRVYRYKLPGGSPFSRTFKVLASTVRNRRSLVVAEIARDNLTAGTNPNSVDRSSKKFKFLDKALFDSTTTAEDVQETRTFLGLIPIFLSTIMMNCCLAQLQTFSVQQGSIMNRTIHGFTIPTQSLTVIPLTIMLASIPLYENLLPLLCRGGKSDSFKFAPLRRIGLGLALASVSMAVAAVVESKRRAAANHEGTSISVFWLGWQYLLLGVADMLTLGGMLEFFYSEAPGSMRSVCTALSWGSTSMGYFLSSVLVSVTNKVSGKLGHEWLGGHDLNRARMDLYYTLLCVLNFVNLLNYAFWARRY